MPYAGGVAVSQILAHREKLALNQQNFSKDVAGNTQQVRTTNIIIFFLYLNVIVEILVLSCLNLNVILNIFNYYRSMSGSISNLVPEHDSFFV